MEISRSYDRLISTMGFPTLVRCHLYIESGPWSWNWKILGALCQHDSYWSLWGSSHHSIDSHDFNYGGYNKSYILSQNNFNCEHHLNFEKMLEKAYINYFFIESMYLNNHRNAILSLSLSGPSIECMIILLDNMTLIWSNYFQPNTQFMATNV